MYLSSYVVTCLTAGGVENFHFLAPGGSPSLEIDIVIPKILLYEGMVGCILK